MTNNDIHTFITQLIEKLGVSVDEIVREDIAGQIVYQIKTSDSAKLIGSRGDTIRSLNHIVKKVFEGSEERFTVDVNGYRTQKIEDLKKTAQLLADRARSLKYNVELNPMSSYERMIVHAALADEPHIATESHGEGRDRRVVIRYVE